MLPSKEGGEMGRVRGGTNRNLRTWKLTSGVSQKGSQSGFSGSLQGFHCRDG